MERHIDSTRLKSVELDILRTFISVCEKSSLKYYLLGGSCLGAVRHNGFIPWDDDIDVGLPRADYNKFMKIGQSLLPSYYFLQNHMTDPEYYVNFAKIRDSRTTFIESSLKNLRINHGVYIDVFPLDYYHEKGDGIFRIKDLLFKGRESVEYSCDYSIKMKMLQFVSCIVCPSVKTAVKKRDELMQSLSSGDLYANICGAWGKKEITPVEWFGNGYTVTFEDLKVTIPQMFHEYLTKLYGDYMTFPPVEKRVGHHHTEVIDLDRPYTDYIQQTQRTKRQ